MYVYPALAFAVYMWLCAPWLTMSDYNVITKADLQELAANIEGDIEFPDEHTECLLSDKMVFTAWTCPYVNSFAIILPESTDDVSVTIAFITKYETPFSIKSGGNSIGGYSKCEQCINLNMERMHGIEYETGSALNQAFDANLVEEDVYIMVESGVNMSALVLSFTANSYRRRIPHPDGGGLTAGGFYQSGGWHESIRQHGYASDYVVGVEIVLHDGSVFTVFDDLCDSHDSSSSSSSSDDGECEYEKDLLWALRGSGGGSFGVVTKYYLKTLEIEQPDNLLDFRLKYKLVDVASGVELMRACQHFTQYTDTGYQLDCQISVDTPSESVPYGYYIRMNGKYFGQHIHEANATVHEMLLSAELLPFVVSAEFTYPPIDYDLDTFVGFGVGDLPGLMNTRFIDSYEELTDEFYEALLSYYVDTVGLVDGRRCICGLPGSQCTECVPGVNDYLSCCGVGARAIFILYGEATYVTDPDNCYTSAPNRQSVGRVSLIPGTTSTENFDALKETVIEPLLQAGMDAVWPYLGEQNYVGYRDHVDTTLDMYFGAGNEAILQELKRIKCKYDPRDVFHHALTIPAEDCDEGGSSSSDSDSESAEKAYHVAVERVMSESAGRELEAGDAAEIALVFSYLMVSILFVLVGVCIGYNLAGSNAYAPNLHKSP